MHALFAIARATLLESLRRRDLTVLAIGMTLLLAFLGAARWVGLEQPAVGTFLLNLSLTLVLVSAHLITLLISARQLPEELEQRTLYPLLARPIRRMDVLLGKWIACACMGIGLCAALLTPVLILVPQLEFYDHRTLIQLVALQVPALMLTAAIPQCLVLILPRGLALFGSLLIVFGADYWVRFGPRFPLIYLIPNPARLNLALRYTDGIGPLSAGQWTILFWAALLWTFGLLGLAVARFERRRL